MRLDSTEGDEGVRIADELVCIVGEKLVDDIDNAWELEAVVVKDDQPTLDDVSRDVRVVGAHRRIIVKSVDKRHADRPAEQIVAVTDNLCTRTTEEVQQWLAAHPRWSFQFTPTHASWLNQIEICFSILWRRLLKYGIFPSEQDLAEQMLAFVETYNQTAKPFKWTYAGKDLEG